MDTRRDIALISISIDPGAGPQGRRLVSLGPPHRGNRPGDRGHRPHGSGARNADGRRARDRPGGATLGRPPASRRAILDRHPQRNTAVSTGCREGCTGHHRMAAGSLGEIDVPFHASHRLDTLPEAWAGNGPAIGTLENERTSPQMVVPRPGIDEMGEVTHPPGRCSVSSIPHTMCASCPAASPRCR